MLQSQQPTNSRHLALVPSILPAPFLIPMVLPRNEAVRGRRG